MKHKVVIETRVWFWIKRYRYFCKGCKEAGLWHKSDKHAAAEGWYHDDVTLFQMLTTKPPEPPQA